MVGSAQPSSFPFPISAVGPTTTHFITSAAALRLGHFLHRRFISNRLYLGILSHSFFKNISPLRHVPAIKDVWHERALKFGGCNFLQWSLYDASFATCSSCLCFFSGEESRNDSTNIGKTHSDASRRVSSDGRQWTNILLAINVLAYIAQFATQGKLFYWGAKINSLIDKGQLWRLATSSFLHANLGHLMVNCYSLNSVGPTVENIGGPRRYLAVYIISAVTGSAMSYWFNKAPAVGASGAIFGLVGSFAVFVLRHRGMVKDSKGDLQHIARVLILNMGIGLISRGIDNWGHLGGLIGGAAASWFLGPAWRYEYLSSDGRRVFADRAPIFSLISRKRAPR
uniref:Rhomboid protein Ilepu_RBL10 n=1 Tax=Ilex purpurea TaxID=185544 RepID=A0A0A7E6G1_9AQUA|nr:rhomboid protein Ilepu_RBL10 [Ilex purpurea]